MIARQSDIRNKVIAPVLKKLGIIDQWGNGLKLIADELKAYPEIEFKWFERGLQFQFLKKNYKPDGTVALMEEQACPFRYSSSSNPKEPSAVFVINNWCCSRLGIGPIAASGVQSEAATAVTAFMPNSAKMPWLPITGRPLKVS